MGRIIADFINIADFSLDETNQVGLITLRRLDFFDILQKAKTVIKNRGTEFKQYDTVQDMIDSKETENVFALNDFYQIVFAVPTEIVRTFCDAANYIIGLEILYPTKPLQYVTNDENATYDLEVRTENGGDIVFDGKNMSISAIANVMKVLDNKSSIGLTGYNIYRIIRSMEVKE